MFAAFLAGSNSIIPDSLYIQSRRKVKLGARGPDTVRTAHGHGGSEGVTGSLRTYKENLEAPPGIEPGMEVLQTKNDIGRSTETAIFIGLFSA
jgi:hypothetical protein